MALLGASLTAARAYVGVTTRPLCLRLRFFPPFGRLFSLFFFFKPFCSVWVVCVLLSSRVYSLRTYGRYNALPHLLNGASVCHLFFYFFASPTVLMSLMYRRFSFLLWRLHQSSTSSFSLPVSFLCDALLLLTLNLRDRLVFFSLSLFSFDT